MNDTQTKIQFALISHTNAGKTTLARTLIGVDVGEVRDEPHVTTVSESHVLIKSDSGCPCPRKTDSLADVKIQQ